MVEGSIIKATFKYILQAALGFRCQSGIGGHKDRRLHGG
jgi:hypothetical protein